MSIQRYKDTQNSTDSGLQLSVRAVRSILLYCQDWSNKALSRSQKLQSIKSGQILCDAMVENMIDALPNNEQQLLATIFTKTSIDLFECEVNSNKSLLENERALLSILKILGSKE